MKATSGRLAELDGLRGVAALSVVGLHLFTIYPASWTKHLLTQTPLALVWQGHAAVILFFVLSGMVLSRGFLTRVEPLPPVRFIARFWFLRVLRIYPAFWAALAVSFLAMSAFHHDGMTGTSPWAQSVWQHVHITRAEVLKHLSIVLPFNSHLFDPPTWSMLIEMRFSLLMPLLILLVRKWNQTGLALVFAASLPLAVVFEPLYFLPVFLCGMTLAFYFDAVLQWAARENAVVLAGLALIGCTLYAVPTVANPPSQWGGTFAVSLGAVLLIVVAVGWAPARQFFSSRVCQFLGRISYSLYLLHFPLLWLVMSHALPVTGSITLAFLAAFPVILGASYVCYLLIERPFINLSHRVAKAYFPLAIQPAVASGPQRDSAGSTPAP